ncbi:MAG TPA: thioredoxin family protein [Gemmatimonadaceae bacterium]|nr:thioredoxin family protein [Gemmatimonadaceae bacterium]
MNALVLALTLSVCTAETPNVLAGDIDYAKLFASGETFAAFLEKAKARKEQWHGNYGKAAVPDALAARAARITGTWNVLVVAVDSCSDSVSTIPYIAKLVETMPNVTLRIVNSTDGKEVMEGHRTPDDRAATPTVILLDSAFVERGCWVERPRELQAKIAGEKKSDKNAEVFEGKMAWYEKDQGASTQAEFVEMLEKAARGEAACDAKPNASSQ